MLKFLEGLLILILIFSFSKSFGQSTHTIPQDCLRIQNGLCIDKNELGYVDGVTSNIQTQLDSTVHKDGAETITGAKVFEAPFYASSTTDGFNPCPSMTDTEMLAISSPQDGACVNNTTLDTWLRYSSADSVWEEMGGGGGISNWETAHDYDAGDVVIESLKIYQANSDHTSDVNFADDLAASKWVQIANNVTDASGVLPMANGGTSKALSPVAGGVVITDGDSMEVAASGVTGRVFTANGTSAPTWNIPNISLEDGSGASTAEAIIVPNYQKTATGVNAYRVESGNTNLLENPSFEHSTIATGWSLGFLPLGGASAVSALYDGDKALQIEYDGTTPVNVCGNSTLYASTFADGTTEGVARIAYKTDITSTPLYLCPQVAGSVPTSITAQCFPLSADDKPHDNAFISFVLGGTSNGLCVTSNGVDVTGKLTLDKAWVAAEDLKQTVSNVGSAKDFTPTGTWTTNSTYTGKWRQVGEKLEAEVNIALSGAPNSSTLKIDLPSGYTIDSSKYLDLNEASIGKGTALDTGVDRQDLRVGIAGTQISVFVLQKPAGNYISSNTPITQAIPFSFGAGDVVNVHFSVYVTQFSASSTVYQAPTNNNGISEVMFNSQPITNAPDGFISAMNKSIGKSSGDYQGSDYKALYDVLWAQAGLSTTVGDVYVISSAKGASANADWDAGKTITVDYLTNSPVIRAAGTGKNLGMFEQDSFQGHFHGSTNSSQVSGSSSASVSVQLWTGSPYTSQATVPQSTGDDLQNSGYGTPRQSTETRPDSTYLNAWIRYRAPVVYGNFKQLSDFEAKFGASFGSSGYQKFPSGLIIQWGTTPSGTSSAVSTTFPIPFPNACLQITTSKNGSSGATYETIINSKSTTGFTSINSSGGSNSLSANYMAIGY